MTMVLAPGGTLRQRRTPLAVAAALTVLTMLLSSCTSTTDGQPVAADTPTETTAPAVDDADATATGVSFERIAAPEIASDASGLQLQDIWIFGDVRGVSDSGEITGLVDDLVDELTPRAEPAITLNETLEFAPLPELEGVFVSALGEIRNDIPVHFGLFRLPDSVGDPQQDGRGTLGLVTAAPATVTNVAGGDELVFDPDQVDALAGYQSILLDYVFGQAKPAESVTSAGSEPIAVLAERFAAGSVQWAGIDPGETGNLQPALRRGVAGSSESAAVAAVQAAGAGSLRNTAAGGAWLRDNGGGGGMGFPIKDAFLPGPAEIAFTLLCIAAGVLIVGAGVLITTVLCTSIDVMGALLNVPKAIDDNMPCEGSCDGGTPGGGGSSVTDPHLSTFDGERRSMMAVGEFDLLLTEGMRVQARTIPWNEAGTVSVNNAVALHVMGATVVVDTERGAPGTIVIDGADVPMETSEGIRFDNGATILRRGNALIVDWQDGRSVTARVYSKSLDLFIGMPDDYPEFTGLLGNYDGKADNDFFTRDGQRPTELTDEAFYGEVVESWRVSEDDNLFGTPLTHDRTYPKPGEPRQPQHRALAEAVCQAAGLTGDYYEFCLTDVGATGDVRWVTRLVDTQGWHQPHAQRFPDDFPPHVVFLEDRGLTEVPVVADSAGHALVTVSGEDGIEMVAIDTDTDADPRTTDPADWSTQVAWRTPVDPHCPAVAGDGWVAVPGTDQVDDGHGEIIDVRVVIFLDPATGTETDRVALPTDRGRVCAGIAATDGTVVLRVEEDETRLVGVDASSAEVVFDNEADGAIAGPVAAADGSVWVVTAVDGALAAQRIDPDSGKTDPAIALPGDTLAGTPVATADGFVAPVSGEGPEALVRVAGDGVVWQTDFPIALGGKEYGVPKRLAADAVTVAGYSGSEAVIVVDAATGEVRGRAVASSFNNNGEHLTLHHGNIVVGPFGGKHWVEGFDPYTLGRIFSFEAPPGPQVNDAKRFDSLGAGGLVVQVSVSDDDYASGIAVVINR